MFPSGGGNLEEPAAQPLSAARGSCLKLNIDASVQSDSSVAGLGAIVRDVTGQVLLARAYNDGPYLDVAFAEAATIRFGLMLSKDASLWPIQVEFDCQSVVNNILAKCIPLPEIARILEVGAW
ncbi:hypothetical protein ACOSQ3_009568 [Xanthoceras sorbifolium]